MGVSYRNPDYERQLGSQSAIYQTEWQQFLANRKALMDEITKASMAVAEHDTGTLHRASMTPPTGEVTPQVTGRPAGRDELIAQARFWDIPQPENMDPQQLMRLIEQHRQEMPRDQQTTAASASLAALGLASEAGGAAARVAGNLFGLAKELPFAGDALAQILKTEKAKAWLYDLGMKTSEFTEAARAAQPAGDKGAFEVLAASGKVGGYALPAMLAWNAIGATAGVAVPTAWAARVGSPIARAALHGGLTGLVLEGGSDESRGTKIFSIGMGAAFGAATALPKVGAALGLGAVGAGIGAQVGDTPEERTRHGVEGFVAGALIGATPLLAAAAGKIRQDMKSPFDARVDAAVTALPSGRPPQQATARMTEQPTYPAGPDYEVGGQAPARQEPQLLVRSDPVTSEPVIVEGATHVQQVEAPAQLRRLMSPERARLTEDLNYAETPLVYDPNIVQPEPRWVQTPTVIRGQIAAVSSTPQPPRQLAGTRVVNPITGQPLTVYHGTGVDFEVVDPTKADPEALFGPGFYTTDNPGVASGYAGTGAYAIKAGAEAEALARVNAATGLPALQIQDLQFAIRGIGSGSLNPEDFKSVGVNIDDLVEVKTMPNVKPLRLNVQNPFDIDKTYQTDEINSLVDKLKTQLPGYDWEKVRLDLAPWTSGIIQHDLQPMTGEELYRGISQAQTVAPMHGVTREEWYQYNQYGQPNVMGKVGLNSALQQIGYDGITHIGGARTGSDSHRVWIAFRPDQVHSPWDVPDLNTVDAATSADALSKQATLMESEQLPEFVGKAQITDSDVVQASKATNPGGVSIIRGLSQPTKVLLDHPDVTFVQRGQMFDALVGSVSPQQVNEYTRYGVFSGQKVVTSTGIEATVSKVLGDRGLITLARESGGPPLRVRADKILPSRFSDPQVSVPDLWPQFKSDLMNGVNLDASAAGMAPVESMTDPRVTSLMQQKMEDFFDKKGVTNPGARQALELDFSRRWVQELRDLDNESSLMNQELADDAVLEANAREESDSHYQVVSIEEKAEKRGFIWISRPEMGGVFKDTINPGAPDIPMSTDEAASEFLARVDRQLPDHTPISDVPVEVGEFFPQDLTRDPRLATEDLGDSLRNTVDRLDGENVEEVLDAMGGRGGGGGGPTLPPVPPNGGALPPGGPRRVTLGEQFDRMRRADPEKLHAMIERFKGVMFSKMRYTRYAMLNTEKMLYGEGVTEGRAWKHYDDLDTARVHAFNEGQPWLKEYGDIMRMIPRQLHRDGVVTRTHEIQDTNERYLAWQRVQATYGLSDSQMSKVLQADDKITDWNHRFAVMMSGDQAFDFGMEREIYRYMSHVRARQAQGIADPYAVPNLSPNVEFFAEHARTGNLQFRVMDTREIGAHMVRAAMFKKYEAEPWQQFIEAWDDPRVPESMRAYMTDWARLVRYGYDPAGELTVRAVQGTMAKVFKTPVTAREAQHLLNAPTGAMYMSMLAGRMSIFFRDAVQPMLALAKVEAPHIGGVYRDVLKGAGQKMTSAEEQKLVEMYHRGLDGGWIEKENPNLEAAGYFEEAAGTRDNELLHLTPEQTARRERGARVGDLVYQLPAWLVRPSESKLSTLKWYARQGQLHRLIVGESGYRQATQVLAEYRQATINAVVSRDASAIPSYEAMADKAYFNSWEPPIQLRLRELVDAGDDEGAATLFARQIADWSQFKYGRKEGPAVMRGNVGRWASMLGNFTGQFLEGAISASANGSPRQIARYWKTVAGVTATLYGMKAATGWSFDKWAWIPGVFQYSGGPLVQTAATAVTTAGGLIAKSQGRNPSPLQQEAMRESFGSRDAGFADYFPYTGYVRSAAEYSAAMQGDNPLEQIARYTVTGDRGSRIDMMRMLEEYARQQAGGHMPAGALSPNGGQQPSSGRPDGYEFPHGNYGPPSRHPGSGAMQ